MEDAIFQERTDLRILNEAVVSITTEIKKVDDRGSGSDIIGYPV